MIAAALVALAVSAQPGVPELPPRTDPNVAWLTWGNDWFGIPGARTDDHRTNEFAAGLRRGSWVVTLDDSMLTLFGEDDRAPELLASAVASTAGEVSGDAAARLVWWTVSDVTIWAGLRYRVRAGDFDGAALEATAAYERGLCYEFGFSLGRALAFESTYSLRDRAAVGAFTFTTALP